LPDTYQLAGFRLGTTTSTSTNRRDKLPNGVGTDTAGAPIVAAGDNPERLRNEATFAHLCGVSPLDASSASSCDTGSTAAGTARRRVQGIHATAR